MLFQKITEHGQDGRLQFAERKPQMCKVAGEEAPLSRKYLRFLSTDLWMAHTWVRRHVAPWGAPFEPRCA
jgi:hypothetical protein